MTTKHRITVTFESDDAADMEDAYTAIQSASNLAADDGARNVRVRIETRRDRRALPADPGADGDEE